MTSVLPTAGFSKPLRSMTVTGLAMILLALAGGIGWLVYDGVGTGATVFPSRSPSQRLSVLRADEPILFWVSIGLYATIALGAVGLVRWGVAQTRPNR